MVMNKFKRITGRTIVPDTSVLINRTLSHMIESGEILRGLLILLRRRN